MDGVFYVVDDDEGEGAGECPPPPRADEWEDEFDF